MHIHSFIKCQIPSPSKEMYVRICYLSQNSSAPYTIWNLSSDILFNISLLHKCVICQLFFRHVSGLAVGHLQEAHLFFDVCRLCVNLRGRNSTYMIKMYDIKVVLWQLKSYKEQGSNRDIGNDKPQLSCTACEIRDQRPTGYLLMLFRAHSPCSYNTLQEAWVWLSTRLID